MNTTTDNAQGLRDLIAHWTRLSKQGETVPVEICWGDGERSRVEVYSADQMIRYARDAIGRAAAPAAPATPERKLTRMEYAQALVLLTHDINAGHAEFKLEGVTEGENEMGDWTVTVHQHGQPTPESAEPVDKRIGNDELDRFDEVYEREWEAHAEAFPNSGARGGADQHATKAALEDFVARRSPTPAASESSFAATHPSDACGGQRSQSEIALREALNALADRVSRLYDHPYQRYERSEIVADLRALATPQEQAASSPATLASTPAAEGSRTGKASSAQSPEHNK